MLTVNLRKRETVKIEVNGVVVKLTLARDGSERDGGKVRLGIETSHPSQICFPDRSGKKEE